MSGDKKMGFADILISIRLVGFIIMTGRVLTPPCPTLLWDGLQAGVIGNLFIFTKRTKIRSLAHYGGHSYEHFGISFGSVGIGSAAASEILREREGSQQSEKMHSPGPAPV